VVDRGVAWLCCGLAALVVALLVLTLPASASAQLAICAPGTGAGKCDSPEGLAVDREKGLLYVADTGNNRIDVFQSNGSFVMGFGWGVADGTTQAPQTCGPGASPPTVTCFPGIAGSGEGQLHLGLHAQVAVDNDPGSPSHHDIYIADSRNLRVQKFDPEGHFLLMFGKEVNSGTSGKPDLCTSAGPPTDVCGAGSEGSGAGEFNQLTGIGVDGAGVVYVADMRRIGECTLPGATSNREFAKRVQRFNAAGEPIAQLALADTPCGEISGLAVTSVGAFFLANEGEPIDKYSSAGALLGTLNPTAATTALGVDSSDNLFAAQREPRHLTEGNRQLITEYDPGGNLLRRFGYDDFERVPRSVAPFHSAGGEIFVGTEEPEGVTYLSFPPPGPLVSPASLAVTGKGNLRATLNAELNPEGKATEYHFEYVTQKGYEEQGNSFSGPQTKSTTVKTVPIKAGTPKEEEEDRFSLHGLSEPVGCANPVTELAKCLIPETRYRFRIVASNADGGGNTPQEASFETEPPFRFLGTWSTEVGGESAILHAELNPLGIATTGVFEYLDDAEYQANVENSLPPFTGAAKIPASGSIGFGSGEAPAARSVAASPLAPATTYHYRISAIDSLIAEPVAGPERTFRTFSPAAIGPCANDPFRYGAGASLPDCRAYEMVSPPSKEGTDIKRGTESANSVAAAFDESSVTGDRFSFGSVHTIGETESAPYVSQFIASRDPGTGWHSHGISPPKTTLILPVIKTLDTELRVLSPDLCEAWFRTVSEPVLAPGGVAGYPNLYRRADQECGEGGFEAITTSGPPLANTPEAQREKVKRSNALELQGLSSDGSTAIYAWNDNLPGATPTPTPQPAECSTKGLGCTLRLYEQTRGGPLQFVCVLPNGQPSKTPCTAGTKNGPVAFVGHARETNLQNAISADGQRVFWSDSAEGPGKIYVRIGGTETVAVSKAAEEASTTTASQFYAAAEDGGKAIFTTGGKLYEFLVDSKTTNQIAEGVGGVMGVSADASRVYFTSSKAIAGAGQNSQGEEAVPGKANLYLYEAGLPAGFSFVATLAAVDAKLEPDFFSALALPPFERASRVSSDGLHAAFMSSAGPASEAAEGVPAPTGYDNTDAVSGQADNEAYVFDAASGKLRCASCNPTGERPTGKNIGGELTQRWAAGVIPGWESVLYAPRALAEDGKRLFFESSDPLVARDTNGVTDVYEWEATGEGTCTASSYTYSAANEGCIDLISSGKADKAAEFIDASPAGRDAFFSSDERLAGQDVDDLVDIYDARAEGGFPPPEPPAPECEAEACQHPPGAPRFQTPSSAQYTGPGNVEEGGKKQPKCRKGYHKVKKHGKVRCVKNKKKASKGKGGGSAR
jgi:hypothetical protein